MLKGTFLDWRILSNFRPPLFVSVILLYSPSCGRIAAAGAVDYFLWSEIAPTQQVHIPFQATVTAKDSSGNTVNGFAGSVSSIARVRSPAPPLVISEVDTVFTKAVEFTNPSDALQDISGWQILFFDAISWPATRSWFFVPDGTTCPAGGVFQVNPFGSSSGTYPIFFTRAPIAWSGAPINNPIAVLLIDRSGAVIDFFCAVDAYPDQIKNPTALPTNAWSGQPLIVNNSGILSFQRVGGYNHHNKADWTIAPKTLGSTNSGLRIPFVAGYRSVITSPATIDLIAGSWTGLISVAEPAKDLFLHADDGTGHAGDSNPFEATAGPVINLSVPENAYESSPGLVGSGNVRILQPVGTNMVVSLVSS